MNPQLNIALQAGRKAADFIHRSSDRLDTLKIEQKGESDYVTQIDKKAELIIIEALKKAYPDHNILGEESGAIESQDSDYQWIIDPLDGTTNFIFGIPHYAVSIALQHKGRTELGVVIDAAKQDEFVAIRGAGTTLNGRRVRVRERTGIERTLLATGIPFGQNAKQKTINPYFDTLKSLTLETAGIRRLGVAALDLAYVASGKFDGYWESGLKSWDIAAGALLVQEAGGLVSDFTGAQNFLTEGDIVAGSPKVFKAILQTVSACKARTV